MSLVVQSLMSSNALTANTTSSTTGGTAATVPFAQTLVQTMGGNTAEGTTPLFGNLASLLQGLLNVVQPAGEDGGDTGSQNADLLSGLTEDLEKLDENISSDPALQAALQGWLLQVSALLLGAASADNTDGTESDAGAAAGQLSLLAQNPETLRFAVQDDLNSLVAMIQDAAASGNDETAAKGITLLTNFTAMLEQVPVAENKAKTKNVPVLNQSTTPVEQPMATDSKDKVQDKAFSVLNNRSGEVAAPKSVTVLASSVPSTGSVDTTVELSSTSAAKVLTAVDSNKALLNDDSLAAEVMVVAEDHEIVTAGQLSMRGGITAPLKAEALPVPVPAQHFAQEMTGFITGKLEIVKKGGIAEATISLFPENLGQVDVKITMQNGHLVAQFLTEHAAAKDMLEQQMTQLRAALQSQGLQVEKLEVTQNNTPLQSQFNQEGRQPGSGGQQPGNRSKERREDSGDAVLSAELNREWKEWVSDEARAERNQGGSFSAKA